MDLGQFAAMSSPERTRRMNRGQSVPPVYKDCGSPKAQRKQQQQQHQHPAWLQALKGLGKRRRKSTTSAHTGWQCTSCNRNRNSHLYSASCGKVRCDESLLAFGPQLEVHLLLDL